LFVTSERVESIVSLADFFFAADLRSGREIGAKSVVRVLGAHAPGDKWIVGHPGIILIRINRGRNAYDLALDSDSSTW
jgi:hypothetical protein